ncbi:MAG: hypothetical protein U5K43_09620 [Halofilum sp. (in: g-proteobacteria)]|nr:hypothetical protein [Halofilum sp. (in: g-proteobacteria)]
MSTRIAGGAPPGVRFAVQRGQFVGREDAGAAPRCRQPLGDRDAAAVGQVVAALLEDLDGLAGEAGRVPRVVSWGWLPGVLCRVG